MNLGNTFGVRVEGRKIKWWKVCDRLGDDMTGATMVQNNQEWRHKYQAIRTAV